MKIFGALAALFFIVLSGLAFLGILVSGLITLGGMIVALSFVFLELFPHPIFAEIWGNFEQVLRTLQVSFRYDHYKPIAVVLIASMSNILCLLALSIFKGSRSLAIKLLPMLDE